MTLFLYHSSGHWELQFPDFCQQRAFFAVGFFLGRCRHVANRSVRPIFVMVPPSNFPLFACVGKRQELLRVQTLRPEPPAAGADERVVRWLARSIFDLCAMVKQIADAGVRFKSPAKLWADTGTSNGRLMLAMLGGLADVERDLIRTLIAEDRSDATARGQHMSDPLPLHRCSRPRPCSAAPRAPN